ncbi:phage tail tube protein [Terriglobus roseus]|uniref:Phage tail tube protein, TTP n=1 Tax=Terriglobus roseus TaxID=392734 RepID=A0A1H4J3P0_9BACT|nr:phage tail tube protein [Terriglobus roseus]SEB40685.1 Phage tail tube protein, TTP [Terriglobus roseus]
MSSPSNLTASHAFTGRGGTLSISSDGTTFTSVNGIKTVTFSAPKTSFADTTSLSTAGAVKTSLPTTIDPGTVTLAVIADQTDTGQLMLNSVFYSQTVLAVKVQYPVQVGMTTGLLRSFAAYVSTSGLANLSLDDAGSYNIDLQITGQITDTAGA